MRVQTTGRAALQIALASAIAASATAQTLFTTSHRYPADDLPFATRLDDVDGDGHLDCVATNYFSDTLSVYLGTGSGTLVPVGTSTVAHNPRGLALGELDGDGNVDAVAVLPSAGLGSVEVLLGDGAGGFTSAGLYTVGGFPVWAELGFIDGDQLLDIAVGNQATDDVAVLLGAGGGLFGPPTHFAVGYSTEEIALGDIEGDGDLDIVVGSWLDNRVACLQGDGNGGFVPGNSRFALSPKSIALADLDGNGTLDLVTSSTGSDLVEVFPGTLGGTLGPSTVTPAGDYAAGVAVADVNADGVPDVVASSVQGSSLSVFVGTGGGNIARTIESPVSVAPWHLSAGDLNEDGIPDVVVVEHTGDSVTAYLGDGVGSFVEYCTAKVNSLGCLPELYAWGTPSRGNLSSFVIGVSNLRSVSTAMFIYKVGGAPASFPFQGGTLCIGPGGIRRTPLRDSGGYAGDNCTGVAQMDFNRFALGQDGGNPDPALLVPGITYRVQLWGRDSGDPFGVALSNAIEVTPWR